MRHFTFLLFTAATFSAIYGVKSKATGTKKSELPELVHFPKAAVTCDAPLCAQISRKIMLEGGYIADAAIAGLLCMGVMHPHSSGIGGGLAAVYYNKTSGATKVIAARETAASAANASMFDNLPKNSQLSGPLAMAVPAEVRGYMELKKLGNNAMPWARLFEPSIALLTQGYPVDSHLAAALKSTEKIIKNNKIFGDVYLNPLTGEVYREGDKIVDLVLADTLEAIAEFGGDYFYKEDSPLAQAIIHDLKNAGSIITAQDLSSYQVQVQKSVQVKFGNLTLTTAGPPTSGVSMIFALRLLEKLKQNLKLNDATSSQYLVEAFKFAFARRGKLGDPADKKYKKRIEKHVLDLSTNEEYLQQALQKIKSNWTSEDLVYYREQKASTSAGTAHFAIVGENGDAISVTTTVGNYFGCKVRSNHTGVIFNNKMNNFLINPATRDISPANRLDPGKRPMNTACPSIWTDKNGTVRLAIGAAGGMKIITAVTTSTINHLWYEMNIKEAISARRLHHSLRPMQLDYELGYNEMVVQELGSYGHKLVLVKPTASVVGISRDANDVLWASYDPRKPGSSDGI